MAYPVLENLNFVVGDRRLRLPALPGSQVQIAVVLGLEIKNQAVFRGSLGDLKYVAEIPQ